MGRPVDILINNAGIMAAPLARSARGIESHLATNYLGHAQLVSLLAPALKAAGKARLISVTSTGHHWSPVIFDDLNFERRPYDKWQAYGQSKTADCLLAVKASAHLLSSGVDRAGCSSRADRFDQSGPLSHAGGSALAADQPGAAPITRQSISRQWRAGAATSIWAAPTAPVLEGAGTALSRRLPCGADPGRPQLFQRRHARGARSHRRRPPLGRSRTDCWACHCRYRPAECLQKLGFFSLALYYKQHIQECDARRMWP